MNKKQKAAAIALSAVMACGLFAGCSELTTTNTRLDLNQVVATVNIADSESFAKEFGEDKKSTVTTAEITKLEMIMSYMSNGGDNLLGSYNNSAKAVFDAIANSLVQRQIYLQYAKAYFLTKDGGKWTDEDGTEYTYTQAGYEAAVADKTGIERELAGLGYFLTDKNKAVAEYNLRVSFNNNLDSYEKEIIDKEEDIEYESSVRTTPTGVNTANADFVDPAYRIYTGTGIADNASPKGSYETVDGSTTSYRKRAYDKFITALRGNSLIEKGENTSDVESLNYFKMQKANSYAGLLIQKLGDAFTEEAEAKITDQYCADKFTEAKANQLKDFTADISKLESAMDSVSDTSFVLTAPENNFEFGFVVNILLPFSTAQSDALKAADQDFGDTKGNKFSTRAALLKNVLATDQRGSWFTGETDYSYKPESTAAKYPATGDNREWLFFEDNFAADGKYEILKNYYGQYTYNGTYDADKRAYKPNRIDINGFLGEMKGYLNYAFGSEVVNETKNLGNSYYTQNWYKANGEVDYEKFIYAEGSVNFAADYDANRIFVADSKENKAFSVIRELSFAYNTDTAGLNSYLGYAVTANKTDFVSEFEYAAQYAVKQGAGNYVVVPSDYGWHIIYCTFSFSKGGVRYDPFTEYSTAQKDVEGSFSNLFFESIKADTASTDASNRQTKMLADYNDSYDIFENRYKNLTSSN